MRVLIGIVERLVSPNAANISFLSVAFYIAELSFYDIFPDELEGVNNSLAKWCSWLLVYPISHLTHFILPVVLSDRFCMLSFVSLSDLYDSHHRIVDPRI